MSSRNLFLTTLGVGFCLFHLSASAGEKGHAPHWGYSGQAGPHNWGSLSNKFRACQNGIKQSPINLKPKSRVEGKNLRFAYQSNAYRVKDNGHTIQVNFDPGNYVKIRGEKYDLLQLHFHSKSEHTIEGRHYPMEIHFVHKNKKGHLGVVGVMVKEGHHNPDIEKIWSHIPGKRGREIAAQQTFDPGKLVPYSKKYFHYWGSLTTPPCSEGVNWNVMSKPIELSRLQIQEFRKRYKGNNRPIQSRYSRHVANY